MASDEERPRVERPNPSATSEGWIEEVRLNPQVLLAAVVVIVALIVAFAAFAIAENRTDADVDERIVAECARVEDPAGCVEAMP